MALFGSGCSTALGVLSLLQHPLCRPDCLAISMLPLEALEFCYC